MAVRSYSHGKMAEETHKPRVRINRENTKKVADNPQSKTQKRKNNKESHMRSNTAGMR